MTSKIFESYFVIFRVHFAGRLPREQFGFIKGHSTSLQLLITTELINAVYGRKEYTIGVFRSLEGL